MVIADNQKVNRIEALLCEWFDGVSFIEIYRSSIGDVFAEIYDTDENELAEFNVTQLAKDIERELDG